MLLNTVNISSISGGLSEETIRIFFSSCGKILKLELNKKADEIEKMKITFDSHKAAKSALRLNGAQLDDSKLIVEADYFGNIQKYTEIINYYIMIVSNYLKTCIKEQSFRLSKCLSYGYVFSDNTFQKGIEFNEKHKISEHLLSIMQSVFKKIKVINDKYSIDKKLKNFNSKYDILDTLKKKINIIMHYFQLTMNTKIGNKIYTFYIKFCEKCRNIHEEARRLANLKQKKLKQT
ncbi:hypothetical protein PCANB_000757 [Pneumocystis canis]|nr:hypothetical protein PCK1_000869 [Pneumocystis canis]KAG5437328.1 hypothetical protein PCANB_000757 [Pneumocystis canis]